jgi:putative ABC transport system ATP-binding protein
MSAPAVQIEGLTRTYGVAPAAVTALAGIDVVFVRGTSTAVMGPSGSGKSTLLHCAAGLDRPTSGRVRIGDAELSTMSETAASPPYSTTWRTPTGTPEPTTSSARVPSAFP